MPRDGAVIFGDLEDKLEVLQVACSKSDRRGQYPVARLIERYGREAKLVDWKDTITADCPRRTNARIVRFQSCRPSWFHLPRQTEEMSGSHHGVCWM